MNSEECYFCGQRVYVLERISAEGRFFHRSCFSCHRCGITLRLGSYTFDQATGEDDDVHVHAMCYVNDSVYSQCNKVLCYSYS